MKEVGGGGGEEKEKKEEEEADDDMLWADTQWCPQTYQLSQC
jgi:hypothetical protein